LGRFSGSQWRRYFLRCGTFAKKKEGQTTGWIGYTWSKTDLQFENLNNGKAFPYRYGRRHDASIIATHRLNKHVDLSATWVYGTGAAFTLPLSKHDLPEGADGPLIDKSDDSEAVSYTHLTL